ncbi:cyclic nucleotide-binding domain-containing protein [Patescibacteria group bacterium]|nr:cyclic nucleotide-binding domain-containing protein [Candidatus Falkowbacteria bacterium]MBU3906489.1 cyclic nucleotide-binding domain-containing protein [Patescibacteria group bacterium]MCG2698223.1 cyclic nucleotide-binding domain-containing protein [Candidatus Parcubacteria bacterium]MBU4015616.1 cyclic nucleotide-binding domain-containing protein [Patescibacteria group bacterium]MBU4026972.1 cyclic nucleotide-binding domain-containing protein [Patescibacteria group bacterium]
MIEIRVAKSKEDLEAVYKLRHDTYVKRDGKFNPEDFPDGMMSDKFDAHSIILIAIKDDIPIGTIRCTEDIPEIGLPIDRHYDINKIRETRKYNKPLYCVGMLAEDVRYKSLGMLKNLFGFLFTLANQRGLRDAVAIVNSSQESIMNKLGLKRIGKEFWSDEIKNYVVPMYAAKEMLSDFLYEKTSLEFAMFGESFRRIVLNKNENLCKEGDIGNEFYVITNGSVSVYKKHGKGSEYKIAMLGPGSIIGEMALVGKNTKRSATVRANITGTVFKALSKNDFSEALKDHEKALSLSKVLMERIDLLNSCVKSNADICSRVKAKKAIPMPKKLLFFIQKLKREKFKAGQIICKQGNKGNTAYIIEKGKVEVYIDNTRVAALFKNSIFGEMAALGNGIRTATVIASSETEARKIPKKILLNMLSEPETVKYFFLILCNRIREMNEKLADADIKRKIGQNIIDLLVRMQNEREFDDYFADGSEETRDIEWVAQSLGYEFKDIELFLTQLRKTKIIILDENKEIHVFNAEKLRNFSFTIDITN